MSQLVEMKLLLIILHAEYLICTLLNCRYLITILSNKCSGVKNEIVIYSLVEWK